MHGYSTDSDERRVVPLFLAILAIAFAWTSSGLLASARLSVPWWTEGPSSLAFYGALYAFFDKHLWKYRLMRGLGLVKTPNLNGRWRGYLTSSFDHHAKRHDVVVSIFQTWTQISVFFMTRTSLSRSCVAVVQVSDPEGVALVYQYQNEPLANAASTMHMHYGTAMLRMPNRTGLTGTYYAGRDRGTFGQISCCRAA
jgi:SMODS-associating 2TM, beta-strand rich effector domain